jgi:hypothetical protein
VEEVDVARKEKFTAKQVVDVLHKTRGMQGAAAVELECSPGTIRNYAKRYPSVRQALKDEKDLNLDAAELSLLRAVDRGEGWAVCFFLKTRGKQRGYVEKTEVEVLVKQELQSAIALMEDELEPDEFMRVAAVLAKLKG